MIDYDSEYNKVKNAPPDKQLAAFKHFCNLIIEKKNKNELDLAEAAYEICGTVASALSPELDENPIIKQIMDIACDLELYPDHSHRGQSDWDDLIRLVSHLS
jgi:hypothetical protein